MYRIIIEKLLKWAKKTNRKPLILQGARQVGKTYIANVFGKNNYENVVYCQLEGNEYLQSCFDILEPIEIIKRIEYEKKEKIVKEKTLLILDEIQNVKGALTSLKYFCEQAPEYNVIALGSLLGVAVNREEFSFPVGKVDTVEMYPLNFEEFLLATNNEELNEKIKKSFSTNLKLDDYYHKKALELYKTFLYVGGMPEIVNTYVRDKNEIIISEYQNEIVKAYLADMSKYNKENLVAKTRIVYKNLSVQLSKENTKFKYNLLKTGARANEYEEAIEWIALSGIANLIYRLENVKLPLNANKNIKDFKMYVNDVGLLSSMENIKMNDIMYGSKFLNEFYGGMVENYVFNELKINGYDLYYLNEDNTLEIDFITRIGDDVIPIEVKSSERIKSKSLIKYIEKYNPKYSIRISEKNFGFENNIKSVPLYAVFCI